MTRARPDGGVQRSRLEADLLLRLKLAGLRVLEQYRAIPDRRWRWDFFLPDHNLLIETQGGIWTGGRHVRGKGYENDARKRNAAVSAGYRCVDFTSDQVRSGEAMRTILGMLAPATGPGGRAGG